MEISRTSNGVNYSFFGLNGAESFKLKSRFYGIEFNQQSTSFDLSPSLNGVEQILKIQLEDSTTSTNQEISLLQHNGLGLDIELVTKPHEKYDHNGALTLSDGILGSRPWKGDQWLGFNEDSVVLILNIPKGKKISEIKIGFLDAKGSWIYLPNKVDYFVLSRKGEWRKTQAHVVVEEYQKAILDVKTRKLKVVITPIAKIPKGAEGAGNRPWIFIDEVILNYKK